MEPKEFFEKEELNRLARKMKNGNKIAARTLHEKLVGKVYGFCLTRTRNKNAAEDLTQEIFLKLVTNIRQYEPKKGDFVSWFWTIARNAMIDRTRKAHETTFTDIASAEEGNNGSVEVLATYNPAASYEAGLAVGKISDFIRTLSRDEQEIFQLRFVADLPYKNMSKLLNKPEGTLRIATMRIREKIQEKFRNESYV
jgi:RNA polymerase sigma-70 factor (ECF subfamily)